MASTNDLDRLKKSSQNVQATNDSSEYYSQNQAVRSEEIKTGLDRFNGSWASEFTLPRGNKYENTPIQNIRTGLGLHGYGDIDFVPFVENTNRVGVKGASTLGSPISFEVLGPTLKSPMIDWEWEISNIGGEERITMDRGGDVSITMRQFYGITNDNNASYPYQNNLTEEGGLYVVFRFFDSTVANSDSATSIGDENRLTYHIFKVEDVQSYSFTISSETPLKDKIDYQTNTKIKGLMFIRKKATRMFSVPSSNDTSFFVMPPEKSLSGDTEPPLNYWLDGTFNSEGVQGSIEAYGNRSALPILSSLQLGSLKKLNATLHNTNTLLNEPSNIRILIKASDNIAPTLDLTKANDLLDAISWVGKIVRIVSVDTTEASEFSQGSKEDLIGYFEVVEEFYAGGFLLSLKGVTEQNHATGVISWNQVKATEAEKVRLEITVHESISEFHAKANPQPHEVESTRIKSLISPMVSKDPVDHRATMMRANECSWDGSSIGNLLDLGFKAVVYPAKIHSNGDLVPDFDNPVDDNLYEVDYEGATVYFSTAPTQAQNITDHAQNPTGNIVLFISCVALSQEASFGNYFTAKEDDIEKNAFSLPKIESILTTTQESLQSQNTIPSEIYLPNISVSEIPVTGSIELWKNLESNSSEYPDYDYIRIRYTNVVSYKQGVKLTVSSFDDLGLMNLANIERAFTVGHAEFTRNPSLSFRETLSAGLSLRSDNVSFESGMITYDNAGNIRLNVSDLKNTTGNISYDSTTQDWILDSNTSKKYQIGLEVKRGDLIASNVIEFTDSDLSIKPYSVSFDGISFSPGSVYGDTGGGIILSSNDTFISGEDLKGFYLNTEGASIATKEDPAWTQNERLVFGVDYTGSRSHPFLTKYISKINPDDISASPAPEVQVSVLLNEALSADGHTIDLASSEDDKAFFVGRNPAVYPAYAYAETIPLTVANVDSITATYADVLNGVVPASRYLLSLEATETGQEGKWVSILVNTPELDLDVNNYASQEEMLQSIVKLLNQDLYFGHTARFLDRAGFYEGFRQDDDGATLTPNTQLNEEINNNTLHKVQGERQLLWVYANDVRHPRYPYNAGDDTTWSLALICTGRGCNNLLFAPTDAELKAKAILRENRLVNVIASLGEAIGNQGDVPFMNVFFSHKDNPYYQRIGYFHDGDSLADNTTQVNNPTILSQKACLDLGFPEQGILPLGRILGESFLVDKQNGGSFYLYYNEESGGREASSPIRNSNAPSAPYSLHQALYALSNYLERYPYESADSTLQSHFLDNPNFSLNWKDELSESDLRNMVWASRDSLAFNFDFSSSGGYFKIYSTFSGNPRNRDSFLSAYEGQQTGYDDYIVSIDSDLFLPPRFDETVLQKGDQFYLQNSKVHAKGVIVNRLRVETASVTSKLTLRVLLQSTGGQYGGFSETNGFQPNLVSIFTNSSPNYDALTYEFASFMVGNSILWNEGNIKSLLSSTSIQSFNNNSLRDTSAVDGGYGTFGSQSATLVSGGRIGLFSGLPLTNSGISFASISGGITSGQKLELEQDFGNYETNSYRTFETFLDHGIFSYVSLPSGTGGSNSGTIGSLSRERKKLSSYESSVFGGSAGLRISGDAQLFVQNIRVLGSNQRTAFILHTDNAPATTTQYLINNGVQTQARSNYWMSYDPTLTGGSTGYYPQSDGRYGEHLAERGFGGHTPSGVGLFSSSSDSSITDVSVRRTASVSLGLTIADLKGISSSLGQNLVDQDADEGKINYFLGSVNTRTDAKTGDTIFKLGQSISSEIPTLALPALKGCFLYLDSETPNETMGFFKIIDTPVISPIDASSREAKFGSENTLHDYGIDYESRVRNTLGSVVANITVRIESNSVFSKIPTTQGQQNKVYTEQPMSPSSNSYGSFGYKWRILHQNSQNNYYSNVYIFDVVDQGGSPTNAPSDLFGLEINPRALGKKSLPAEIIPLSKYGSPVDVPSNLNFPDTSFIDNTSSQNIRLLGVHRNMDSRGKTSSLAFISSTMDNAQISTIFNGVEIGGSPSDLESYLGDSPARIVVYSSERSDRLDEAKKISTQKRFENGEAGFVTLGYPERMGLGVVIDGGLGVVSGNAVRVHPQKGNYDSLGALSLYSYPYTDPREEIRDGNAVTLPSRFNRTEFYGDIVLAGFNSEIILDDARTSNGIIARSNENEASASTVRNYQSLSLRYGNLSSHYRSTAVVGDGTALSIQGTFKDYAEILLDSDLKNYISKVNNVVDYYYFNNNLFEQLPPPPLPNDTIFPWTNTGIRVKNGGGLVYERSFRPQDATGSDLVVSHSKGAKSDRGIRGLEIPAFGECLLLPKGPATLGGRVVSKNDGSGIKLRMGMTPTDLPLYEFYNGPTRYNYGGTHAISIGNVLQEHGVYGRPNVPTDNDYRRHLSYAPKNNEGTDVIEFDPGILSQSYHHSRSNESEIWGGSNEILSPRGVQIYGFMAYTNPDPVDFANNKFSLFYFFRGKLKYIELTIKAPINNAIIEEDPSSTANKRAYRWDTVNVGGNYPSNTVAPHTVDYDFYFYLPEGVRTFFVEVSGTNYNATLDITMGMLFETKSQITKEINHGVNPMYATASTGYSVNNYNDAVDYQANGPDYYYMDFSGFGLAQGEISGDVTEFIHGVQVIPSGVLASNSNTQIASIHFLYYRDLNLATLNLISTHLNISPNFASNNDVLSATLEGNSSDFSDYNETVNERLNSRFQVRLLDGMILEDVTNGSFYTVGEVGRYRGWHSYMKPTSQVGDYVHYEHGMHSLDYTHATDKLKNIYSKPLIRNANHGSMVAVNGHSSPEILYDIPSHFNYESSMYGYLNQDAYLDQEMKNGVGDVTDGGFVRRPLLGHKFRVVPNVEFVPVLGYRSVKGGLAVPYDKGNSYNSYIREADAVLYDANYSFTRNDIGKKVYICGTYEYAYVGWWVITDIVESYIVNPTNIGGVAGGTEYDVAVVRKVKRSGEYLTNPQSQNNLILPMRPKAPVIEATLDGNSNGKNVIGVGGLDTNIDSHLADPFCPEASTMVLGKTLYFDDLPTSYNSYDFINNIWLGLNFRDDNGDLFFIGANSTDADVTTYNGNFRTQGSEYIEDFNTNDHYNGVEIGLYFKNQLSLSAWSSYDGSTPFIKWEIKYGHQDGYSEYPVLGSSGYTEPTKVICGISCTIDESVLTASQRETVLGRGTFLSVDLLFNPCLKDGPTSEFSKWDTTMASISLVELYKTNNPNSDFIYFRGFFYRKGVNSNTDIGWGDKNNFLPTMYSGVDADYTDTDISLVANATALSSNTRQVNSASGGIRWVFSAPLAEENVGSYLHLTKQRPYRFGVPTYSQREQLKVHTKLDGTINTETLTNPFGWTSGYQNKADISSSKGEEILDLSTDIFRINRCPTTGEILVGGDCESYSVEDILCRTQRGWTKKGLEISYSPLSIGGNWQDSETGNLPSTDSLNYPIMYALQPIAREKIVTVNPSNANSSILFAKGQKGSSPMIIPANPLALETTGSFSITATSSFSDVANDFVQHGGAAEYFVVDPATTDISVSISSLTLDDNTWGEDYQWGERMMMDVSRPWLLMGRENVMQTHDFEFAPPNVVSNDRNLPENVLQTYTNIDQLFKIESGNTEGNSNQIYRESTYKTPTAVYTWCPSGEWWQLQTPLYSRRNDSDSNNISVISPTTPSPTLRIDLTEAFTQSVSAGSGINSPYASRTPRGVRLNRIWVNFGVDGEQSPLPGSPFNYDSEDYYQDFAGTDLSDTTLSNTLVKDTILNASDSSGYKDKSKKFHNRSVTFNLVVEIPGSLGSSQEDFSLIYGSGESAGGASEIEEAWADFVNEDYSFMPLGGSNGSFSGGRLPTGAYNHSNNSNRYGKLLSVSDPMPYGKPRYNGGTVVVPLYVNREAGDMMPNIMERFVTVGPARFRDRVYEEVTNATTDYKKYQYISDWAIGNAQTGLGAINYVNTAQIFTQDGVGLFNDSSYPFEVNSITPVVWGSQNFFSSYLDSYNIPNDYNNPNNKLHTAVSPFLYSTFNDVRSAGVLASSMPRSSRLGGGVLSSFSSGIYSDSNLFDPIGAFVRSPLAIHSSAVTGITISHGATSSNTYTQNYNIQGGDTLANVNDTKTSSNAFTVALTPVGDDFDAPYSYIEMPSISGNANKDAKDLYKDYYDANITTQFWNLGRYGRTLEVAKGTAVKDRRFKVGNWLDKILDAYGIPAQSGSMLPVGARVFLEVTTPWSYSKSANNSGTWISSVKCSFEVETADGTAWTQDVNTMGED